MKDNPDFLANGGDKYFHCLANCRAALQGAAWWANLLSEARELFDERVKGTRGRGAMRIVKQTTTGGSQMVRAVGFTARRTVRTDYHRPTDLGAIATCILLTVAACRGMDQAESLFHTGSDPELHTLVERDGYRQNSSRLTLSISASCATSTQTKFG
jgi:hypothetical protein